VILSEHPWRTLLECLLTSLNREYNPAECTNENKYNRVFQIHYQNSKCMAYISPCMQLNPICYIYTSAIIS
jgi:hypothetical protein